MKNSLFTVIAVVGFSTVTNAKNHIEIKEVKITAQLVYDSCDLRQEIAENLALENGSDQWEAYFYGASEWGRCMGGN
jgi:hypothetical protein